MSHIKGLAVGASVIRSDVIPYTIPPWWTDEEETPHQLKSSLERTVLLEQQVTSLQRQLTALQLVFDRLYSVPGMPGQLAAQHDFWLKSRRNSM